MLCKIISKATEFVAEIFKRKICIVGVMILISLRFPIQNTLKTELVMPCNAISNVSISDWGEEHDENCICINR